MSGNDANSLEGLSGLIRTATDPGSGGKPRSAAPVHLWNPPFCGDIDMRISADGTWFYAGTPIRRPQLVRLFASILRLDPEGYRLVTPAECVGITVDDLPFRAVEMRQSGSQLAFRTDLDEWVEAGPEHALRFDPGAQDGVKPAVHVRGGLWARLTRSVSHELLESAEFGEEHAGIHAGGVFFPI